jgi:Fe-S cluster assembly protein SufD
MTHPERFRHEGVKVKTASEKLNSYLTDFDDLVLNVREKPWLGKLRHDAFEQFCEAGFPTTHDEDWRFTSVARLAQTPFRLAQNGASAFAAVKLNVSPIKGAACRLVFMNGRFVEELSTQSSTAGLAAGALATQIASRSEQIEKHLGAYLNVKRDAFCALNTAFLEDGACVNISRDTCVDCPVHLVFVSAAGVTPTVSHPRNLIVAEDGSEVTIVEEYVSLGEGVTFCNSVTELVAGENATVSHYRVEREGPKSFQISTLRMEQSRSSNVSTHSILVGGDLVRNNVHAVLAGEGGECLINGLFVGHEHQHLDNYMLVEHKSPHTNSRQFYNGVLAGHAHGVFHGRIIVHKLAQKTDAKQTNRNLLLSDDAQVDTKPQLEIYADDVKCTHGATIGQIDPEALFYLRSRGMDEEASRKLLLLAFTSECLGRMNEGAARDHAAELIEGAIFGAPDRGNGEETAR